MYSFGRSKDAILQTLMTCFIVKNISKHNNLITPEVPQTTIITLTHNDYKICNIVVCIIQTFVLSVEINNTIAWMMRTS